MNNDKLKDLIKELIRKELDEISTTGASTGYNTPNAFAGGKVGWRGTDMGEESMPNTDERKSKAVDDMHPDVLEEARSRYKNLKESDVYKKPASKVSYLCLEMKKLMREVDYLVDISTRLKTECDVNSGMYWGRTQQDLAEIFEYTKRISKKLKKIKK
jgi:hypothetical protein